MMFIACESTRHFIYCIKVVACELRYHACSANRTTANSQITILSVSDPYTFTESFSLECFHLAFNIVVCSGVGTLWLG